MADAYEYVASGITAPANRAVAVTTNDGSDLAFVARALYVGGAGDIALITSGGDTVTFAAVTAGSILPVRTARVLATGTTATNIIAIW